MELKPYQQQVIDDISRFLQITRTKHNIPDSFHEFWFCHPRTPLTPFPNRAVEPYKNNVPQTPHVCVKVPTAGGKTFIASAALKPIFEGINFDVQRPKVVVWLVPSLSILEQTKQNLQDPYHPYRQRINTDFANRVVVLDKEQLLQGTNFTNSSVLDNLTICVMSFDSLRAKKKEDRKLHQDNSSLYTFKPLFSDEEDISVSRVIQRLHPVVIVDESHNAETELSVDMLQQLQPAFILDLTATPRRNSNIISFVDALELKKNNMVKLPVIVKNHQIKSEVVRTAIDLRNRLEQDARAEQAKGGKYIRPIVLFQAQPKTGDDNTTFEKIKQSLIELHIPEQQIKIKTAEINELKNVNLMAEDCHVRYIITVNALKEGWDCPFAYILASLADKNSAVDVEQILGRVLRLPYIRKNTTSPMLNMSYVLTSSSRFADTLDNIVQGLNRAGFSDRDYRHIEEARTISEPPQEEQTVLALFAPTPISVPPGDTDPTVNEIDVAAIQEMRETDFVQEIERTAIEEEQKLDKKLQEDTQESVIPQEISTMSKTYPIKQIFAEKAKEVELPVFYTKTPQGGELFWDADSKIPFSKEQLLESFSLSNADCNIDFSAAHGDIYRVDIDTTTNEHTPRCFIVSGKQYDRIANYILSLESKDSKIKECTNRMMKRIGRINPISDRDIEEYIKKVLSNFSQDDFAQLLQYENSYAEKIKQKITALTQAYSHQKFCECLDTDAVFMEPTYTLPQSLSLSKTGAAISKSLYEREDDINGFEREVIMEVSNLENVEFWHRNLERGRGFCINGFINHYPDFIIKTKKGKIVLLETKGDQLYAEDKIELGALWASKAGNNYRYFLVYNTKEVKGAYTKADFIRRLKEL